MVFFAELLAILLTIFALLLVFQLWTSRPVAKQFDNIPLYFFLILALFLIWNEKMSTEVYLSSFSWLLNQLSILPRQSGPRLVAIIIMGSVYYSLRNELLKQWNSQEFYEMFKSKFPWFVMFIVVFFGAGSFFFVDYTRIAEMWVLPVQSSSEEIVPGTSGIMGTPIPSPTGAPRGRTLKSIGEFSARIVFPLLGGIVAVVALLFTWMRTNAIMEQTRNTTKTLENTRKTLENSQKQITTEQFKNAIDHLGSVEQTVVFGGVHSLHDLATNNVEYRQRVLEILCSFIREETSKIDYQKRILENMLQGKKGKSSTSDYDDEDPGAVSNLEYFYNSLNIESMSGYIASQIVIQTIIDKLFRSEVSRKTYQDYEADLSGSFLCGMDFTKAQLPKVKFRNANLQRVNFDGANLQETDFEGADLRYAQLHANLKQAVFRNANLQRAKMQQSNLQKADFEGANLKYADLHRANLRGADFKNARLDRVDLQKADLWSANLLRTNLQWANLQDANLAEADLRGAILRGVRLISADLCGASLEGAWLWGALLFLTKMDEDTDLIVAQLQGSQSVDEIYYNTLIKEAVRNDDFLKTDIASVCIFARNGTELKLTPNEKRIWFYRKRAILDDLIPNKVVKIAQGLKLLD